MGLLSNLLNLPFSVIEDTADLLDEGEVVPRRVLRDLF